MAQMGKWAFIVGLVISVVGGLGISQPWFWWVLAVLGLIVGFLNISAGEVHGFLLASIALIVSERPRRAAVRRRLRDQHHREPDRVPVGCGAGGGHEEPVRGRQGLADRTFSQVSKKTGSRPSSEAPGRRGAPAGVRLVVGCLADVRL